MQSDLISCSCQHSRIRQQKNLLERRKTETETETETEIDSTSLFTTTNLDGMHSGDS